jgi:hypothetical protein
VIAPHIKANGSRDGQMVGRPPVYKKASPVMTILLMLTLVLTPAINRSHRSEQTWRVYKGAWFEVRYPATFKARPSQKSSSADKDYDSVFFIAPDRSVEFYVFSPQWNGKPDDIEIDEQNEVYVTQNTEKKSNITIRRVTIKAKNGSYLRSFEDSENTETNNRTVFGIKYRDQAAYSRYRQAYLTFKGSLRQFAD